MLRPFAFSLRCLLLSLRPPPPLPQVWLHDLLPPNASRDPAATRRTRVALQRAQRGQMAAGGGTVLLTAGVVDTDDRRRQYGAPLIDEEEWAAARGGIAAAAAFSLHRLESSTQQYSEGELRRREMMSGALRRGDDGCWCLLLLECGTTALHCCLVFPCAAFPSTCACAEDSYSVWEHSHQKHAADISKEMFPLALRVTRGSWRRVSRLFSAGGQELQVGVY